MEHKNVWKNYQAGQLAEMETFAKDYMSFISSGKTERECARLAVQAAEAAGFKDLEQFETLTVGDKVYVNHMGKSFMAFVIGEEPLENGMNILGAHIDSPRIDVKSNPLYEEGDLAYLDTHYYGGIKKYQWVTLPLALHGVLIKKNGEKITLDIGEHEGDPVFCISDLLPHLAREQMQKTGGKLIDGEDMDLIVGSRPQADEEKEAVRACVLSLLKEQYGIEEEDFLSAELEIVPAGKARDMGFDRSMILAYGQDDRICAYPSMRAILDFKGVPKRTLCCILTDKEEIGSVGATGVGSRYFEYTVAELLNKAGEYSELKRMRMLRNSFMLSSDVAVGFDPLYASVFEKKNAAYLGGGICFTKFTGSGGKGFGSDANPEFIAKLLGVLDDHNVIYQFEEIGRVDAGGGGTIAEHLAKYCMNVLDAGVPVLSMHSPFEVASKADLYETYRCYCAFLKGLQ